MKAREDLTCNICKLGGTMIRSGNEGYGHYGHDGAWFGPCKGHPAGQPEPAPTPPSEPRCAECGGDKIIYNYHTGHPDDCWKCNRKAPSPPSETCRGCGCLFMEDNPRTIGGWCYHCAADTVDVTTPGNPGEAPSFATLSPGTPRSAEAPSEDEERRAVDNAVSDYQIALELSTPWRDAADKLYAKLDKARAR